MPLSGEIGRQNLSWTGIKLVTSNKSIRSKPKLENIGQQFPKLFDGQLGTIKGFTAELKVKENAPPQYFKPRTVPFALRDKVEAAI